MLRRSLIRAAAFAAPILIAVQTLWAGTVISDFNGAALGSYSPRDGWAAFSTGTTDRGVHNDGSVGRGAYHNVNWAGATWGIGEISTSIIDLSGFESVKVDARVVNVAGHTGTPRLRFALDLPAGTEWSTPAVNVGSTYQTYTFNLTTMTRTAGAGPLNLAGGTPKFIVEKNGQGGNARFDMDQIIGVTTGGGEFELAPVVLRPPPDGDAVRAMWMYAFNDDLKVDTDASAQAILDFCAREGVNRIYFHAANAYNGSAEIRDNLRTFLRTARASGIRVEAHLDGINEYSNAPLIRSYIDAVIDFHEATPTDFDDDFEGIHFDIEFWLSSAWSGAANESARQNVAREFLDDVLVNARDHLDLRGWPELEIGVDLSSHFDTSGMLPSPMLYNGVTQYFIEHVMDHADHVVYMSYIDFADGLLEWTSFELDRAAAKGRTIQLAADIAPVPPEVPINSFADNFTPTPYSAMTKALEEFHTLLTPARLAALDGFCIFYYKHYAPHAPSPHNVADLDGDCDADGDDLDSLASFIDGPTSAATGLARDGDLDLNGVVDLADFALLARCYTGSGECGPIPVECHR